MLGDRYYMRDHDQPQGWSVSMWLILANAVVYAVQLLVPLVFGARHGLEDYLALSPTQLARGHVWQLLTFQFLHGGPLHLVLNCAMLYMFGRPVEEVLGRQRYLIMYLYSGAVGGLLQASCSWLFPNHFGLHPVVGASAGVFGLIAAFAALHWEQPLTMLLAFIIPVTIKAKYLLVVEIVLAVFGLLQGTSSGIAHGAHLGGMFGGLSLILFLYRSGSRGFPWERFTARPPRRELVKVVARQRTGWVSGPSSPAEDLPPGEFISKEVDPILDKISAQGIQSLTDRERKILEAARARMSKR